MNDEFLCRSCRLYKKREALCTDPSSKGTTCKACFKKVQQRMHPDENAGITIGGRPTDFTYAHVEKKRRTARAKNFSKGVLPERFRST